MLIWLLGFGVGFAQAKPTKKRTLPKRTVGKYGYRMRLVDAGTKTLGVEVSSDLNDVLDEHQHEVTLTHPFYIGETEVTLAFWQLIMGENPTGMAGSDCFRSDYPLIVTEDFPVFCVDFEMALEMANLLSEWEGFEACYDLTGHEPSWAIPDCNGYRLPTEAEWEFAAIGAPKSAKKATDSFLFSGSNDSTVVAWSSLNSGGHPNPVALKQSNSFGLYDMSGNVWEWVWDWYGEYERAATVDPMGPEYGHQRVLRGGSWSNAPIDLRITNRFFRPPTHRSAQIGLRLVRRPK